MVTIVFALQTQMLPTPQRAIECEEKRLMQDDADALLSIFERMLRRDEDGGGGEISLARDEVQFAR